MKNKYFKLIGLIIVLFTSIGFMFYYFYAYIIGLILLISMYIFKVINWKKRNVFKNNRKMRILYELFIFHCKGNKLRKGLKIIYPERCIYYDECKKKNSKQRLICKTNYLMLLDIIKLKGLNDEKRENC